MTLEDLQRRIDRLEAENQLLHARVSQLEASPIDRSGSDAQPELVLADA